jgi:peptide/nickel transport system permease protein
MANTPTELPASLGRQKLGFRTIQRAILRWPWIPVLILSVFCIAATFASQLSPHNPRVGDLGENFTPPAWAEDGSDKFLLGTDNLGRDIYSRILFGARVSLAVAAVTIVIGILLGVSLGLIAGYAGGWVDEIIMRITDIGMAFPLILLALALAAVFGQSFSLLVIILVAWVWTSFARQVRAEALQLKEMDYVKLARVAGASGIRIMYKHILPGTINTVIVIATLRVGLVILVEASLSFLGAGVPPSIPTWGLMVSEGRQFINSSWWISFFPGIAIFLVVMSFNFLGDWLRDKFDPRLRQL